MVNRLVLILRFWVVLGFSALPVARAQEVLVAAASDLSLCWPTLLAAYPVTNADEQPKVAFGSSGNFFAQIKNGGPYHLFLSADKAYPEQLISADLADAGSFYIYAYGHLALWTMRKELAMPIHKLSDLAFLNRANIKRIALANPAHAPYGRAARALLQDAQLWLPLQSKLVNADNITQTVQFVQTGNADIGLVAMSLLKAPTLRGLGFMQELPATIAPPLAQALVLTKRGKSSAAARKFADYLHSEPARTALRACGFTVPEREQ